MTSKAIESEQADTPLSEKNTRRPCSWTKPEESDETKISEQEDSFDSGSEADNPDDEDFTLNGPKKKRKKKLKKKRPEKERPVKKPKNVRRVPTFDEVMSAQIHHAFKYVDYDMFESEHSSIDDKPEEEADELAVHERTPTPEPPKKKRIIIYPWCPIGITGGRPVTDVSKLS